MFPFRRIELTCLRTLCALLALVVPAQAQLPTFEPPPPASTLAWFDWYQDLLDSRIAHVSFNRDQSRFVSSSTGDDLADGRTPQSAWATVERARDWLDSANQTGETREVLFKRGDVWRISMGFETNQTGVRFADYGHPGKPAPYFTGFTVVLTASPQWTNAGHPGVYSHALTEPPSWVREDGDADLDAPLERQRSLAEVHSKRGAWWYDTAQARLYVHTRNADDPRSNDRSYEVAFVTGRGFSVGGDRSLVENLRADGFGLDPEATVTQSEAFQIRTRADSGAVIRNCTSFYGASHIFGHNSARGWQGAGTPSSGGVATFIDCVGGFTKYNGLPGETVFNTFSYEGGHEAIFHNCTTARGTLPASEFSGRRAISVFGHSTTGANIGLAIVYGHRTLDHPFGAADPPRFADPPEADTLDDVRAFVVDSVHEGGDGTGSGLSGVVLPGHAYVNCDFRLRPYAESRKAIQAQSVSGWFINSRLTLDLTNQTGPMFALYNTKSTRNRPHLWHSRLDVVSLPADMMFVLDYDGAHASADADVRYTLFSRQSAGGDAIVNVRSGAPIESNAFWRFESAGEGAVELSQPPTEDAPTVCSGLYLSPPETVHQSLVGVRADPINLDEVVSSAPDPGLLVEFDAHLEPRRGVTIGPLQAVPVRADFNLDLTVDARDLARLLTSWGRADPEVDLTNDGVIDAHDLNFVLAMWGPCSP